MYHHPMLAFSRAIANHKQKGLTRLAQAWSAKWDGRWQYQVKDGRFHHPYGGDPLVYSVTPAKVLAFGKGTFTQTSHRF